MRCARSLLLLVIGGGALLGGCNSLIGLDGFDVSGQGGTGGATSCGQGFTPNDKVVRSCLLWDSCSPFPPIATISDCVSLNLQQAFLGTSCTANATSCGDVELCEGYGFVTNQCNGGQTGWRCENNTAIYCAAGKGYYVSCSKRGGQCAQFDTNGDSIPDTADCKVESACTDGTSACDGDTAYDCVGGSGYGAVCTNLGAHCGTQGGQATCYLATPSCSGKVTPCDGNVAQECLTGQLYRYDCGSVGLACSIEPNGPYCVAPACTAANLASCRESCTGTTLHLCYGGAPFDVDCKAYGFSACREFDDKPPPNGVGHYALCAN